MPKQGKGHNCSKAESKAAPVVIKANTARKG